MRTRPKPPPAFVERRRRSAWIWVARDLEAAAEQAGLLDPARLAHRLAQAEGMRSRGETLDVHLPGEAAPLVLRPLRRGGWLGPLLGVRLAGPWRPLHELEVAEALRAAGAPVPPTRFAAAWREGGAWRGAVGTERVPNARDALAFLESAPDPSAVAAAARAVGAALRRFHDAGGCHPDLQVRNLLLVAEGSRYRAFVIDLDRARRREHVSPRERLRELARLYRSLRKRGVEERVGIRGCALALETYLQGDRELARALRRGLALERVRLALHTLGYHLRRARG